jgi:hypothetical protein
LSLPVESFYKIVLPKNYWKSIKKFMGMSAMIDITAQFDRDDYYSNLKKYDELITFTEKYTEGASVQISKITKKPFDTSPSKLIEDIDILSSEVDDINYLHISYFAGF